MCSCKSACTVTVMRMCKCVASSTRVTAPVLRCAGSIQGPGHAELQQVEDRGRLRAGAQGRGRGGHREAGRSAEGLPEDHPGRRQAGASLFAYGPSLPPSTSVAGVEELNLPCLAMGAVAPEYKVCHPCVGSLKLLIPGTLPTRQSQTAFPGTLLGSPPFHTALTRVMTSFAGSQAVPENQQNCLQYVSNIEEAMVKGFPFAVPPEYSGLPQLKVRNL